MSSVGRRSVLLGGAATVFPASARAFETAEVAPGIHVRQGVHEDATAANDDAIANIGFIVGSAAIAVIDPGGSRGDGERLRARIRDVTALPVRYIVMTHFHPDHVFGAEAFAADRPVFVAHAAMPTMMAARGPHDRAALADILGDAEAGDYAAPTMLVSDQASLDLGGRLLQLQAHGTAHTNNDLTVLDPATRTLWAGDLLFVDRVPALDGSILGWLAELDRLKASGAVRAVPGHGRAAVPWPSGAADEERYLKTLVREIRELIRRRGDIETAVATVGLAERERWRLFDDYNGRNVTAAFKELEWE